MIGRLATSLPLALALAGISSAAPHTKWTITEAAQRAAALIEERELRAHVSFLASDLLEGRAPASRGDRLTAAYLGAQLEALGLEPAGSRGYQQPFGIVGISAQLPKAIEVRGRAGSLSLRTGIDLVVFTGEQRERSELRDAELVFAGYGITAPEERWDDFKGADLRGKVLVVLNNDPADDPRAFGGKARLYYGRYPYKYEEGARRGAAGVLVIHTDESAGYPWHVIGSSWWREEYELPLEPGTPTLKVRGWLSGQAAGRVVALGGHDLAELRRRAERRAFQPQPLGVRVSLSVRSTLVRRETANLLARLRGRDPRLRDEAVLLTAHHDHLGVGDPKGNDRIYNGAWDNASGVAGVLAVARAFAALRPAPRRSVVFAFLAAEESGLLGSQHWIDQPTFRRERAAAVFNIDGLNVWGRTRDLAVLGLGRSSLDEPLRAVGAALGRDLRGDPFPELGLYYRSDQLSFARAGVPAVALEPGDDFVGRPRDYGARVTEAFHAEHYHQPSDELRADWDLTGAVEDLRFTFHAAHAVAEQPSAPAWHRGDEFAPKPPRHREAGARR